MIRLGKTSKRNSNRFAISMLGAAVAAVGALAPAAAGAGEGRTRESVSESVSTVRMGFMESLESDLQLVFPTRAIAVPSSEAVVIFRAPEGADVDILEGEHVVWSGTGAGGEPVTARLSGLRAGDVHLLELSLPDDEETLSLPPIVVQSSGSFGIRDAATLAKRIGDTTSWDFNGDGASGTTEEKAKDVVALLRLTEPSVVEDVYLLGESRWEEEAESLWNVYASAANVKNAAVGKYVRLLEGDGSEGTLPASPFSGEALWYGNVSVADDVYSVTDDVYSVGNYIKKPASYNAEFGGGTSDASHSGTILSPEITVPYDGNAKIGFWSWWEIESANPDGFDLMKIKVLQAGTVVKEFQLNPDDYVFGGESYLPHTSGGIDEPPAWRRYEFPIGEFAGENVRFALSFETRDTQYNGFRGWFVDQFFVGANHAPAATDLELSGSPSVGGALSASVTSTDADGDVPRSAKYVWYATDPVQNKKKVVGYGDTLPVTPAYEGSFLTVEAFPYDGKEYGHPASATVWVEGPIVAAWPHDGVVIEAEPIFLHGPTGAEIYYTKDGSDPAAEGNEERSLYGTPITLV
ncbi:MAG TPA: hypothetical protein VEZ72_01960, partial [Paenibacillus sp.]|nr:hypothetical protein [Paenibacillus sp.]